VNFIPLLEFVFKRLLSVRIWLPPLVVGCKNPLHTHRAVHTVVGIALGGQRAVRPRSRGRDEKIPHICRLSIRQMRSVGVRQQRGTMSLDDRTTFAMVHGCDACSRIGLSEGRQRGSARCRCSHWPQRLSGKPIFLSVIMCGDHLRPLSSKCILHSAADLHVRDARGEFRQGVSRTVRALYGTLHGFIWSCVNQHLTEKINTGRFLVA